MKPATKHRWLGAVGVTAAFSLLVTPVAFADDFPDVQEGATQYVSDVAWQNVETGYGTAQRDFRNLGVADQEQYPLTVAGEEFAKGVGLHVEARLDLDLGQKCTQFLSYAGIDDSGTANGGSFFGEFRVLGDDEELASIGRYQGEHATLLDVDVTGVDRLSIVVDQLPGGNNGGSFADLGEATLNCGAEKVAFPIRVHEGENTDLQRLTPGGEAELRILDANPGSDIEVRLDGELLTSAKAADSGDTQAVFAIPSDFDKPDAEIEVRAQDRAGESSIKALSGTVIIPHTGQYYVDCTATDNGDGSEGSPFNSLTPINEMKEFSEGSQILLKRGSHCEGPLEVQGAGTEEARNIITNYGEGDLPTIDGAGEQAALHLIDGSYWTIEGLRITNPGEMGVERQGIMVESLSTAEEAGIVIKDNIVEDVAGWTNKEGNDPRFRNSAGIMIMSDHEAVKPNPGLTNGLTITGNEVSNAGGGGIKLQGDGQHSDGKYHQDVYIAHNYIHGVGGDAIVVHASEDPVVEYNRAIDIGQGKYPFDEGNFAGIWSITSKNPLVRYNVVGNSATSTYDSTAWDCDWGMAEGTCIFEYNYSYGNAGGAFLDCVSGCGPADTNTKSIIRYNIMQDDCRLAGTSGGPEKTWIYNNVFYCPSRDFVDDMKGPREFFNNVVVSPGGEWNEENDVTYGNNAYYGGIQPPATETNAITGEDPKLLAPGTGTEEFAFDGYALRSDSPLLGAGEDRDDFQGEDIFGNTTGDTGNIGVYEGAGETPEPRAWEDSANVTSISHANNLRTGAVEFAGEGRVGYLAEELEQAGLVAGETIEFDGAELTWPANRPGTPDSVAATGQEILLDEAGSELVFVGFSTGETQGGAAVVTYDDGSTEEVAMELPDWRDAEVDSENVVAELPNHNRHTAHYLGDVETVEAANYVFADAVPLDPTKTVTSVALPENSPVIGDGLTLFALTVAGEAELPAPEPASISTDVTQVRQGGELLVSGQTWAAGDSVALTLGDAQLPLGDVTAADDGTFETRVTIPSDAPLGEQTLRAENADSSATADITVLESESAEGGGDGEGDAGAGGSNDGASEEGAGDGLAVTGSEAGILLLTAALVVGLGIAMYRKRAARV